MSKLLEVGSKAPDFTLAVSPDQKLSLNQFQGKPVVLIFYPADWSPVCGDEISTFNDALPEFHKCEAELLGISVDGPWCHKAFVKHRNINYPLLSDFEPKGAIAKLYGAYRDKDGFCERAIYLLDNDGNILWNYLSPIGENPGVLKVLEVLKLYCNQE